MVRPAASSRARRRRPRWGAEVRLPAAEDRQRTLDRPRLVLEVASETKVVNNLTRVDLDASSPARAFKSRSGQRHAPQTPFVATVGQHIRTESKTEAVAAHLLSRRTDVTSIWPQPFWIERMIEGKPSWACPDFLVGHPDGRLSVVEVKAAHETLSMSTLNALAAVRASCDLHGLGFELVTGLAQREQQVFNLLLAFSGSRSLRGAGVEQRAEEIVAAAASPISLRAAWALGPQSQTKPLIWWLLWHNRICFDWSSPITEDSQVLDHASHAVASQSTAGEWRCGPTPCPSLDDLMMDRQ